MKNGARALAMVMMILLGSMMFSGIATAAQKNAVVPKAAAPAQGTTMRMQKFSCVDRGGIGTEAFSFLMPAGWRFDGGVKWVLDNPVMPATGRFTARNPTAPEALEMFPNQALFWTNNQMLLGMFPVGSRYFGAEVRPVVGSEKALREIVLPRFRGNVSNLKVVSQKSLPELAKALGAGKSQPGVKTFGNAAKIRIEYVQNGVPIEEEIVAVVEGFSFPIQTMQGMVTNTNWFVDHIFACKAPKGRLDADAPLYQAMLMSFRVNPQWYNKYTQVVDQLIRAQVRQIQSVGELSRIISRTNNEISDSMMKSYQEREKVYDRISENVSENIRGTEHYQNPFEDRTVELPSRYEHVWTNANGEYVFTDNPNYNPNVGSNTRWEELQKK